MDFADRSTELKKELAGIFMENRAAGIRRNCLFLDFDGVVNVFCPEGSEAWKKAMEKEEFDFCDRDCVERLNTLFRAYPIDLVISSSWRFSGREACEEYLRKYGLDEEIHVVGLTQTEAFMPRYEEVLTYLIEHPFYTNYLVLDDMPMNPIRDHLVQTHPYHGIDEKALEECRNILNKEACISW